MVKAEAIKGVKNRHTQLTVPLSTLSSLDLTWAAILEFAPRIAANRLAQRYLANSSSRQRNKRPATARAQGFTSEALGEQEKALTFNKESCRWTILGEAAEVHRSAPRTEDSDGAERCHNGARAPFPERDRRP